MYGTTSKSNQYNTIFYIVFGMTLIIYILLKLLPAGKSIKITWVYQVYDFKNGEFDIYKTIESYKSFMLGIIIYSGIILILSWVGGRISF